MSRKTIRSFAAAAVLCVTLRAYAFHSGGVAECEGCHAMHNSLEGAAMDPNLPQYAAGPYLLQGNDQSSACLNCHNSAAPGSYHISTDATLLGPGLPPINYTPGGDFAWLKKTYTYCFRGCMGGDLGERHGHNIISADFGYVADSVQTVAPGGSYPAANLQCSSCHDPHGQYRRFADGSIARTGLPIFASGSYQNSINPTVGVSAVGVYRLLAGVGYQPKSLTGSFAFGAPPPAAVVNSTYNRSEATAQTGTIYMSGMSEWCANCHGKMLQNGYVSGMGGLSHPAGNNAKLTPPIVANYNAYVSSGIVTNTDPTKAYSTLAPFEVGGADYAAAKPLAVNTGINLPATTNSTVSCLSCHRAHASGFDSMTRYFLNNEFMTVADASNAAAYDSSTTDGRVSFGKNVAEQQAAYYGRPASVFGPYARNYCNKCHAKD
jgi:hypothetical protein